MITEADIAVMTLAEYVAALNGPEGTLTADLAHWAQCGVHTAKDLGDYLDACVERERQKDRLSAYDYDDRDYYDPYESSFYSDDNDREDYDDPYTTDADRRYYEAMDRMDEEVAYYEQFYDLADREQAEAEEFFPPQRHHIPVKYLDGGDW